MRYVSAPILLALLLVIAACGSDNKGFIPPTVEPTATSDPLSPGVIATADALLQSRTPTPTATVQASPTPASSPTATPLPPDVQLLDFEARIAGYNSDLTARIAASFTLKNNTVGPTEAQIVVPEGFDLVEDDSNGIYTLEPDEDPLAIEITGELPLGVTNLTVEVHSTDASFELKDSVSQEVIVATPMLVSRDVWEYAKETQGTETNNITWFRKWEKRELRVFVAGTDAAVEFYWQVADELSELTGITFIEHDQPLTGDMIVLVGLTVDRLIPLLPVERQADAQVHFQSNAAAFDWELQDDAEILGGLAMAIGEPYSVSFTNHNVLEETTQVLGPGADSPRYPDSIFYEVNGVSGTVTELSSIDRAVLRFLYDTRISAGDTFAEVEARIAFTDDLDAGLLNSLIQDGQPVYVAN